MSYAADLNLNLATRGRTKLTLLTSPTVVVKRTRKRVRPARLVRLR